MPEVELMRHLSADNPRVKDRSFEKNTSAASCQTPTGFYARRGKRILDLVLVIPLLFAAFPIIAVVALGVVLSSGWPPFYCARRLGRKGQEFSMWKIRTMV